MLMGLSDCSLLDSVTGLSLALFYIDYCATHITYNGQTFTPFHANALGNDLPHPSSLFTRTLAISTHHIVRRDSKTRLRIYIDCLASKTCTISSNRKLLLPFTKCVRESITNECLNTLLVILCRCFTLNK